jgi:uncharacterized protein
VVILVKFALTREGLVKVGRRLLSLQGVWFDLSSDELELLVYACGYYSDGFTEADLTVQVCWDAYRLDLVRVGVRPDPRYLCTGYAKTDPVIETAYQTSLRERFW